MTQLHRTEEAADDLTAIRDYIAHDSPSYAQAVVGRIYSAVGRLREFPESRRMVPERGRDDLRELIHAPYRIVCRRTDDAVYILTIFPAARMFPEGGR